MDNSFSRSCNSFNPTNEMIKLTKEKEVEEEEKFDCEICRDTGTIEIMGGTDYDDWTVVNSRRCVCVED